MNEHASLPRAVTGLISWLRAPALGVLAWVALTPALARADGLSVLVNPGDQGEQSRYAVFNVWKGALEQSLRRERAAGLVVNQSIDAAADLGTTRSRLHDVFVAPAHVIGSAVRYGYVPVGSVDKSVQAVLVAPSTSAITSLSDAAGKRLGLPQQDSVVTYLLRGEVNASNSTIKRHFGAVTESRYQDALLVCLQIRRCDVVAVERAVYERWLASGESLKMVMQSKVVPGLSVAIKPGSSLQPEALRVALSNHLPPSAGLKLQAVSSSAFEYVSTLGYFTPRLLPGATVVDAPAVQQLMKAGAQYFDTRTEAEFKAGHPTGAKLLPYVEKSAKEADFKADDDKFDLSKLPADKNLPLIFACNGPECWKSFKASHAAVKAGHTKVHWFRGGFPEWRAANLPIEAQ